MRRIALGLALALGALIRPAVAAEGFNPHAKNAGPRDESRISGDLPAGTIEVLVSNPNGAPLRKIPVRLGILFQKIAEGESHSERFATTDDSGRARFTGLNTGTEYSYHVTLRQGRAEYGSSPFNLDRQSGQSVHLHVYPATSTIDDAPVALRGLLYIEPRDDVFQFDALFLVINVGSISWVPESVVLELPKGFKAFNAQKEMSGAGFSLVEGVGARLDGTFAPGQKEVRFRFQVPKEAHKTVGFRFGMLPRVADFRVIAEASREMDLRVPGFGKAEPGTSPTGKRVLTVGQDFTGAGALSALDIELSGLPIPGPGRWVAVFLAAAFGLTGIGASRGLIRFDSGDDPRRDRDRDRARELLLDEIVEVERSRQKGALGPRAYAEARRTLLDSLTRLGPETLSQARRRPGESRRKPDHRTSGRSSSTG